MQKKLFVFVALIFSSMTVWAAAAPSNVTYSRDANFIYVKSPLRVILNDEQLVALRSGVRFITKQLQGITAPNPDTDPGGDLKALADSAREFDQKLNQLVSLTGDLYGEVAPYGMRLFQ